MAILTLHGAQSGPADSNDVDESTGE
jgi:hypothetical protein